MLSKTNRLVHLLRAAIYLATLFLLFYANEFIPFITYPTPVCFLGVLFFRHWMVCFILAAIVIFLIVSSRSFFESLNYSRKLVHTVLQTIAIIPMSASIIYILFTGSFNPPSIKWVQCDTPNPETQIACMTFANEYSDDVWFYSMPSLICEGEKIGGIYTPPQEPEKSVLYCDWHVTWNNGIAHITTNQEVEKIINQEHGDDPLFIISMGKGQFQLTHYLHEG